MRSSAINAVLSKYQKLVFSVNNSAQRLAVSRGCIGQWSAEGHISAIVCPTNRRLQGSSAPTRWPFCQGYINVETVLHMRAGKIHFNEFHRGQSSPPKNTCSRSWIDGRVQQVSSQKYAACWYQACARRCYSNKSSPVSS